MSFPSPSPRQARVLWTSITALAIAVMLALLGMVFWAAGWLFERLSSVLLPIAFALILAYILDPVVEFFVRRKISRPWAITLVFALATLLTAGILGSVVPDVVRETRQLVITLPANADKLRKKIEDFIEHSNVAHQLESMLRSTTTPIPVVTNSPEAVSLTNRSLAPLSATNHFDTSLRLTEADSLPGGVLFRSDTIKPAGDLEAINSFLNTPLSETFISRAEELLKVLLRWIGGQLGKVSVWAEFLIGLVLVPVYLFYFLLEKQKINRGWTDYLPIKESWAKNEAVFVLQAINDCLIVFFRGQVLVSLTVSALLTIGYFVLGLNYVALIGFVAATLGIVPYLGALTSLAFALTVSIIQFGDWTHPLLVLAVAGTVKLLEDFVISPKIMGERSGLHPLTIIIAVLMGSTLMGGIIGAILAIPLTAVLRTLMFRYIWVRRGSGREVEPLCSP